jgi:hypothetical protein
MFDDLTKNQGAADDPAAQPTPPANLGLGPQEEVSFAQGDLPAPATVNLKPASPAEQTITPGQTAAAPATPPGQAEDIFSSVEEKTPPAKPKVFEPKPVPSAAPAGISPIENENSSHLVKKIIMLSAGILVFAGLAYGGYYGYTRYFKELFGRSVPVANKPAAETPAPIAEEPAAPAEEPVTPPAYEPAAEEPAALPDADQDGLTDEEETALGTDANNIDSDEDGLFDREEVKVYKTDPLDNDTDNDTFLDGDEVKGGYNPLGPGKLYEVK